MTRGEQIERALHTGVCGLRGDVCCWADPEEEAMDCASNPLTRLAEHVAAALAAQEGEHGHRSGCQRFPTGYLCVRHPRMPHLWRGALGMKPLTARRVRRGRRLIAKQACPARWGIRHRWAGMSGLSGAGLFVRCINCGEVE